jgi:hypothetical protein
VSKKKEEKKKQKKIESQIKSNRNVFPLAHYDEEAGGYVMEDGRYFDFIERMPRDIDNSHTDEVQFEMIVQTKFYKMYRNDIKILVMNFPVNTYRQRMYLEETMEDTNSEVRRVWLERSLQELRLVDQNCMKREYYFMLFSKDREDHMKNKKQVAALLGEGGKDALIREIPVQKKHRILMKLCNMNTLVAGEDHDDMEEI